MAWRVQLEILGTLMVRWDMNRDAVRGQFVGCKAPPTNKRRACRYPALIGTLAVVSGYVLHINAFPMRLDGHDALLGLQCALPILFLDAALMLPDWSPGTTTKVCAAAPQGCQL